MRFRRFGQPVAWMVTLNVMGVNLITPVLPAYADYFGVGIAVASSLVISFAVARMATRVWAGAMSDRFGSRRVCVAGAAVQVAGAMASALAPSFQLLLASRLVQGAGSAMFGTSANRHLLVTNARSDLGRATAGFQSGILLGNTLGPAIGGAAAQLGGIWAPFWVQVVIAAVLALGSSRFLAGEVEAPAAARPARPVRLLLALPGFKLLMVMAFGLFFVRAGAMNVLVPAFGDRVLSMPPAAVGAVISAGSLVSLALMTPAGRMADLRGRRPVALAGVFAGAGAVALFGLASSGGALLAVSVAVGVGMGLASVALPTMVGDMAPSGTEGLASGLYRIANDLGWVAGPLMLGWLADRARFGVGFVVAGVPLAAGGLLFARRSYPRGRQLAGPASGRSDIVHDVGNGG